MRKKLFIALSCIFTLGLLGTCCVKSNSVFKCNAEEQVEVGQTETTEQPVNVDEESKSVLQDISQTAYDCIKVIESFFSQPLVIAGVSTTVGALAIFIISKAFGGKGGKKKIEELLKKLAEIGENIKNCVSIKDHNELAKQKDLLVDIFKELLPTIKNIKVKEKCVELLKQLEPVKEEVVEFTKQEHQDVVDESKKVVNEIADILNKD